MTIYYQSKDVQAQIEVFQISIFDSDEVVGTPTIQGEQHHPAPLERITSEH